MAGRESGNGKGTSGTRWVLPVALVLLVFGFVLTLVLLGHSPATATAAALAAGAVVTELLRRVTRAPGAGRAEAEDDDAEA